MEGQGREMMQGGSVEEYNGVARARERERRDRLWRRRQKPESY